MQNDLWKEEGNNWHMRNIEVVEKIKKEDDKIFKYFLENNIDLKSKNILEIGCGTGYRLNWLNNTFNCNCYGVDISEAAINHGKKKYKNIELETASITDFNFSKKFDIIIFGFCLYAIDREYLFYLVNKTNNILNDSGNVIICDFFSNKYYKNTYSYNNNLFSFKMDYSKLFTSNPQYIEIYRKIYNHDIKQINNLTHPDDLCILSVLRKYPINKIY